MRLRFSRLRWPEWVIGGGGLLLLISMFLLPWYQLMKSTPGPPPKYFVAVSLDGWHGLTIGHWLMLLTVLAAFALLFFQARERAPALPVTFTLIASVLGMVTLVWLIVRVWIVPPAGREIGGWIGLLSAAAIVYGGYRSFLLDRIAETDALHDIPTVKLGREGAT